ncbi:MAG: hypothetical protein MN733_00920 [Nitrososphaera sp.]|nr:hypothetical protein [Nitrososphaera sp.]
MQLIVKPKTVLLCFAVVITMINIGNAASMISTHYLGQPFVFGLVPLFDLDKERNIPSYFSSVALLFCSSLLYVIAIARKRKNDRDHLYWGALSIVFLYLSFDEFGELHERLIEPLRTALGTSGVLYYAWVLPYGIFVAIMILIYLPVLRNLGRRIRRLSIIAGVVYIAGAIGCELISGYYFDTHQQKDVIYALIATCEETLEMSGVAIYCYALMSYIDSNVGGVLSFAIASSFKGFMSKEEKQQELKRLKWPRENTLNV